MSPNNDIEYKMKMLGLIAEDFWSSGYRTPEDLPVYNYDFEAKLRSLIPKTATRTRKKGSA